MPLVRIDMYKGRSARDRRAIADVVYDALRAHLNVPDRDRFQVINEHEAGNLLIDPHYMGIDRSEGALLIQVTLSVGRTVAAKQAFYKAVAYGLHDKVGLRREDVFINLVEVTRPDWSFGNGVAQYVEMDAKT
jgi:phenylpyruvate tautomerase PptA (4-oxalocrotonate tautomerase family)